MIRYVHRVQECFTGKDPVALAGVFRISPQLCRHWIGRQVFVPTSLISRLVRLHHWTNLSFFVSQLRRLKNRLEWTLLNDQQVHRRTFVAYERLLR